jgi:hypothetical protein
VSVIFTGFGVGATLESAIATVSIPLLLPIILGGLLGIFSGGKLWGYVFKQSDEIYDEWKGFYANCIFCVMLLGCAIAAFPTIDGVDLQLILGVIAFGAFCAISLAVGAEIISNEELEKTDERLLSK